MYTSITVKSMSTFKVMHKNKRYFLYFLFLFIYYYFNVILHNNTFLCLKYNKIIECKLGYF